MTYLREVRIEYRYGWLYQGPCECGPDLIRGACLAVTGTPVEEALQDTKYDIFLGLEWTAHAWPGGYEIHYITDDCGILCHQCANQELDRTLDPDDEQFCIVGAEINYEDNDLYCDHCNRQILPAYGDQEDEDSKAALALLDESDVIQGEEA